jgi:hypothetical protein
MEGIELQMESASYAFIMYRYFLQFKTLILLIINKHYVIHEHKMKIDQKIVLHLCIRRK